MTERHPGEQRLVLVAVCGGLFLVQLDVTIVNVALRVIQTDLGAAISGLQWVVDAYALVLASLMLAAGDVSDLEGRKRVFLAGLVVFGLGSLGCALAPEILTLIAARAIQGLGAAALLPSSLAILTHAFPDERERARAIGLWAGVSGLSLVAGPLLGGILVDGLGWRAVFWVSGAVASAALFFARRVVPESRGPRGRSIDLPGHLLSTTVLVGLVFALIEGPSLGWNALPVILALVIAGGASAVFVYVELQTPNPMLDLGLFRSRAFSAANFSAGTMNFAVLGMLFAFSLFLQRGQGYSPSAAGVRLLPLFIPLVVTAPLFGRLVGRIGPRIPVGLGLGLAGTGMLFLKDIDIGTSYGAMWWPLLLAGLGLGLATPGIVAAAVGAVPLARAGLASAVNNTCRQAGGAVGVALLGSLAGTHGAPSIQPVMVIAGGALLAGAAVGLALIGRRGDGSAGPRLAPAREGVRSTSLPRRTAFRVSRRIH